MELFGTYCGAQLSFLASSMPTLPAARNHQIFHSNFEWAIGNSKQSLGMNDPQVHNPITITIRFNNR
jgi:hypothetical protein